MTEDTPRESSDQTFGPAGEQPGATPEDVGEDAPRVTPADIQLTDDDAVAAAPSAGEEPEPRINADLVDDPEEVARTIEAASGESVDIVNEDDIT